MKDTANYEQSEEIAIREGKKSLSNAGWLHNRAVEKTKGFFVELRQNNAIYPGYYSVHCVDGVGTKVFLSAWSGNYRLAPIDALAMNANDMATIIHAYPDSINLYIATQTGVEEKHMGEIMSGFADALERIRIPKAPFNVNMGKIETASLDEIISLGVPNKGVDFGVVMTGFIKKHDVPNLNPKPGHLIVGVNSTGLHSNGYTGARHALLKRDSFFKPKLEYRREWRKQYKGRFHLDDKPGILEGKTLLEALEVPTALYLVEAALIGQYYEQSKDIYGINITGNGLHNFNRAGKNVTFEITEEPLKPLPIHKLLIQESHWTPQQAYTKQNMNMGFAYIAPSLDIAEGIVKIVNELGENRAKIMGEVRKSNEEKLKTTLHKPYEGKSLDFIGYSN